MVYFLTFLLCLLAGIASAQEIMIIPLPSGSGQDAVVFSGWPNSNFESYPNIQAEAWTYGGEPGVYRALFEFDLSDIPSEKEIQEATLSLYFTPQADGDEHYGDNGCVIEKITGFWDENLVTWECQPSVTATNQVQLAASENPTQDYPKIDVTPMVKEMVSDPDNSHGFRLSLLTEEHYRRLVFASGDHEDETKHPLLTIHFRSVLGIKNEPSAIHLILFPNPVSDYLTLTFNNPLGGQVTLTFYDHRGNIADVMDGITTGTISYNVDHLVPGLYFVRLTTNRRSFASQKFIVHPSR
jgi:hypothetical protein